MYITIFVKILTTIWKGNIDFDFDFFLLPSHFNYIVIDFMVLI